MATTDARSGFRLPWSSDRQTETETAAPAETPTPESGWSDAAAAATTTDANAEAAPSAEVPAAPADSPTSDESGGAPDPEPAETTEPTPAAAWTAPVDDTPKPAGRKPNKFLADLTKAMQAAAEDARSRSSAQLQSDAKTHVETIHGRASTEAASLRRQADDDVAGIREWSKAEIARIREETEQRITDRKTQLESEIENHAAVIEREIDAVQRMVSAFEDEMTAFFERLLVEEDPTRFATMAENLPEPPSFDDISAVVGLHVDARPADADPAVGAVTDSVVAPDHSDPRTDTTAGADDGLGEPAETEETTTAQESLEGVDATVAAGEAFAAAATDDAAEASSEPAAVADDSSGAVEEADSDVSGRADADGEIDQEAAFAAIQAAAEAAAGAEAASDAAVPADADPDVAIEIVGTHDEDTLEADPRVAALGLSPDYEAAEAEALADADAQQADAEEIPTIGDDALAARLAGLVPAGDAPASDDVTATQVVVVGLVSVASIASFKRHLGRVAGVQSVGVSSGPDGEFVFAVTHAPDANLRDAIPSLPSFQARVTSAVDGAIHVTAHDPEADG